MPPLAQVERAIRLTYAQMMLGAVFAASTGGMFLIGFAIALGADDVLLGLVSTIPQFFVLFQFVAAWLVERGVSRKKLTIVFAMLAPVCWFLIAAIPLFGSSLSRDGRIAVLIAVIALVTIFGQFVGNARGSWLGELVPAERRGKFFGYCTMFAGLVGAVFAVLEGRFLDFIKSQGLLAFTGLFFFGTLFGLAASSLHIPQPDCPLPGGASRPSYWALLRDAMRNRPLVSLALVHAIVAMNGIVGPFIPAYCLRDLGMSYFALGLLNALATAAMLIFSPMWGKAVDRFGCRPILILGLLVWAPCPMIWLLVPPGNLPRAFAMLPLPFFLSGLGISAFSVAVTALMYKVSQPEGRSVQFAAYSAFVTLLGAPMPALGGWLVTYLERTGHRVDLRLTMYVSALFLFLAAIAAGKLKEPGSMGMRTLVFNRVQGRIARLWGMLNQPL